MRAVALGCLGTIALGSAIGAEHSLTVDLLAGHAIHDLASERAGVVTGIVIGPGEALVDLQGLCDELREAAALAVELDYDLLLAVVFVVPWKAMAIEGYYLPVDGVVGAERLVPGKAVDRRTLDNILARAAIPASLLDETDVEHEISCDLDRPSWLLRWEDVQSLAGELPEVVIERARERFRGIHAAILERAAHLPRLASK